LIRIKLVFFYDKSTPTLQLRGQWFDGEIHNRELHMVTSLWFVTRPNYEIMLVCVGGQSRDNGLKVNKE